MTQWIKELMFWVSFGKRVLIYRECISTNSHINFNKKFHQLSNIFVISSYTNPIFEKSIHFDPMGHGPSLHETNYKQYKISVHSKSAIPAEYIMYVVPFKIEKEPLMGTCEKRETRHGHPDKGTGQRTDDSKSMVLCAGMVSRSPKGLKMSIKCVMQR